MLTRYARALAGRVFTPLARALLRAGVSPDVVTLVGTLGVCVGALGFFPRGELFWGVMVVLVFVFSDTVDGTMARLSGASSRWGAFLDSTLDRVADAALFGGLVLFLAGRGGDGLLAGVALYDLVGALLVSYVRARAEGLGLRADVGVAERTERIAVVLTVAGFAGLGVPYVLAAGLWVLALATTVTVVQRALFVRRQILAEDGARPLPTSQPRTPREPR